MYILPLMYNLSHKNVSSNLRHTLKMHFFCSLNMHDFPVPTSHIKISSLEVSSPSPVPYNQVLFLSLNGLLSLPLIICLLLFPWQLCCCYLPEKLLAYWLPREKTTYDEFGKLWWLGKDLTVCWRVGLILEAGQDSGLSLMVWEEADFDCTVLEFDFTFPVQRTFWVKDVPPPHCPYLLHCTVTVSNTRQCNLKFVSNRRPQFSAVRELSSLESLTTVSKTQCFGSSAIWSGSLY